MVRNPEVALLSPIVLAALSDPIKSTEKAVQAFLHAEFFHAFDAPSLALVIPILRRGLTARNSQLKRTSAQCVSLLPVLCADDKSSFKPYARTLMKFVKQILVDPIPEVRQEAARCMGALFKGVDGEEVFPNLVTSLHELLRQENNTSIQRSGTSHGLSQILYVCGTSVAQAAMLPMPGPCSKVLFAVGPRARSDAKQRGEA